MNNRTNLTGLRIVSGLLAVIAVASAYACLPAAAKGADNQQASEEKQGADAVAEIAKTAKFVTDPDTVKRVTDIGAKIAAVAVRDKLPAGFGNDAVYAFKYDYKIIDSKEVNAFSLPGGHVYIYSGLLNLLHTDDELAGVLGHETAHAAHHHISALTHQANKMSTQMALGVLIAVLAHVPPNQIGDLATGAQYADIAQINNRFSEAAETDADHTGMIYMQRAGYNPVGMLTMLLRLKDVEDRSPNIDLGFLQDHPLTPTRIESAKAELTTLGVPVTTEAMRLAAGSIRARTADAAGVTIPAVRLTVGRVPMALLSPANRNEADSAAVMLNALLDNNLRIDQVRAVGSQLFAGGHPVLTFTPDDCKVQPVPATPVQLAQSAKSGLQDAIWEINVLGIGAK